MNYSVCARGKKTHTAADDPTQSNTHTCKYTYMMETKHVAHKACMLVFCATSSFCNNPIDPSTVIAGVQVLVLVELKK